MAKIEESIWDAVYWEEESLAAGTPQVAVLHRQLIGTIDGIHLVMNWAQPLSSSLSRRSSAFLGRPWNWLRGALAWFLGRVAAKLKIDSRNIAATGGFPFGIATTISITFAENGENHASKGHPVKRGGGCGEKEEDCNC